MTLRITVDMFSGRENPVVELKGKEAKDALDRLKPDRKLDKGEPGLPPAPTLGYRGLIVEQVDERAKEFPKQFRLAHGDMFAPRVARRVADEHFEDYFLKIPSVIEKLPFDKGLSDLANEVARFREVRKNWPWEEKVIWPLKPVCPCAPLYEPTWWNDGGQKQLHNNCYNYSANYRTDTFHLVPGGSQPGAASGMTLALPLACASVLAAAVADGLLASPDADNKCPKEGHLVALVCYDWDYHWYRKGRNGRWTHKPGQTAATNLDNVGAIITDPRTANRGPYTSFCGFLVVQHGHIKIK